MDRSPWTTLWSPSFVQGPCTCQEPVKALLTFHGPSVFHAIIVLFFFPKKLPFFFSFKTLPVYCGLYEHRSGCSVFISDYTDAPTSAAFSPSSLLSSFLPLRFQTFLWWRTGTSLPHSVSWSSGSEVLYCSAYKANPSLLKRWKKKTI